MTVVRDLKVKLRINILTIEQIDKGDNERKSNREGPQGRIISSMPEIIIDYEEMMERLSNAAIVLAEGYDVDDTKIPPAVVTDDVTAILTTTAILHGHVQPGGINTTVGFKMGLTKELGTTCACIANPLTGITNQAILYALSNLTANTRYYYRAYATDANYTGGKFGVLKSFTTAAV
jgi:hypothetical protein